MTGPFVDVHSHVVPSGDDGVKSPEQGLELCRKAAQWGTRVLFATPHVWPTLTLTAEREAAVREAHADMASHAARAGLELRLGFELTPTPTLLQEDPRRYRLEGLDAVLMELPFHGSLKLSERLAEHIEAAGLTPVIAHP
jgi:protein-tyrosine phosphatase